MSELLRRAAQRAADILWRSFQAPKTVIARANGDARKVLQAALEGKDLAPTESEKTSP